MIIYFQSFPLLSPGMAVLYQGRALCFTKEEMHTHPRLPMLEEGPRGLGKVCTEAGRGPHCSGPALRALSGFQRSGNCWPHPRDAPCVPVLETDQPDLMLERNFLHELPRVDLSFPASHAGTSDGADGPHTAAAVMESSRDGRFCSPAPERREDDE